VNGMFEVQIKIVELWWVDLLTEASYGLFYKDGNQEVKQITTPHTQNTTGRN